MLLAEVPNCGIWALPAECIGIIIHGILAQGGTPGDVFKLALVGIKELVDL
jgi:hypothetical protein